MIEFRVLGSVEAWVDGVSVDVGHPRQRAVLAVLLVHANHVVSTDQLLDRVWGEQQPERGRDTVYNYLSRLRTALRAADDEVRLDRRSGGYVLAVADQSVDLHQFRALVGQARTTDDDEHALALFEQALGLWHGEPAPGLDTPWATSLRAGLTDERLAAELDHADTALRCGRHTELLASLSVRATQHPFDERVAGQLMLALYRCGRQADALEHYQALRRRLTDELGTDPGRDTQRLHQQILAADQSLTAGNVAPAPRAAVVPRQLPTATTHLVGRASEVSTLTAQMQSVAGEGAVAITAVGGVGGIGKTALALNWAHQNLDRFPDGQLFVDLQGFSPTGAPMPPAEAMRGFLDAVGVDPAQVPADLHAQTGLYRSVVADKRMLIVLDNAASVEQVRPLLPGSPTCTVLVTSRHQLAGLVTGYGAGQLNIDVLPDAQAGELLAHRLGPHRIATEPEAVADLLSMCAGLPLAVGIVAARAHQHPDFRLAVLAEELRDSSARLDALDAGDLRANLRAVLSWSAYALTTPAAKLLGLLGIAPGPDISLPAAVSLTDLPTNQVRVLLRELENASLLQQHVPGRYRMHDLVRLYATDTAHHDLAQNVREAALRRVLDFYTHTAYVADRVLSPHRYPAVRLAPPPPGVHPPTLPDVSAALAWFDTEHACLLAAHHSATTLGWHPTVWQLAWALDSFHYRRGHRRERLAVWLAAADAATHLPDPTLSIHAHQYLGVTYTDLGRHEDAVNHLHQALSIAERHSDPILQIRAHNTLSRAWGQRGDDRPALEHALRALELHRGLDEPVGEARVRNKVGWFTARLGDYNTAREHCEAALTLQRHHHDPEGEAAILDSLGYIDHHSGRHHQAIDHYQQALALLRGIGNTYDVAETLDALGHPHLALGQVEQARAVWQEARQLYQEQGRHDDATRIQRQLDTVHRPGTANTAETGD